MKKSSKIFSIFLVILSALFLTDIAFAQDTTPPTGTISASPLEVRENETFNITVAGEDNIDMGLICYKEENDPSGAWTCYTCAGTSTSCSYTFKRTESALGKYKYFGQVRDAVGNVNLTVPDYVFVLVETDPSVATFSVTYQADQATLNGYLIDMGKAELVQVWFEWGETTAYGKETGPISKNTTGLFSATITGLSPKTVYHFRAVAKNGVGTAFGDDMVTTELIKNGGFETRDLTGWSTTPRGYYKADTEDAYKGLYSGLFGFKEGENIKNGKSGIYQDLTIPSAAANIELSLWYKFYTTDKCDYDFINIYLKDTSDKILKTYLEWCCSGCKVGELHTYGWNRITDDLSAFAGKTVRIYFEVENRSDTRHRSWAYIDEVSIKYIPSSPPSVITKPATGVKPSEAVLNGELTDMGGAGSVEVWFEWGKTTAYGGKTEPIVLKSPGPFSALIGNLSSGTTYHFRAVAKSSGRTFYGGNLKFTTEHSAAGGWICPPNHEDPSDHWSFEERAHDCDILTRAHNGPSGIGWKGFIIFDLGSAVKSNKIRVAATGKGCPDPPCPISDIDILYEGAGTWTNLYQAELPLNHDWVEIPLPYEGMVIKGRFRFYYQQAGWISTLDEFQFYKVPDEPITPPAGNTLEATSIEENTAILHGQVIDDGRELCQFRFQYGKTVAYGTNTPWEVGPGGVGFASGETFGKFISGLEKGVTYHFRAQIKNSAGIASGADKTFFTQSALSGWVSPQGAYGDGWENVHFVFDDELGTYTRRLRAYGEGQWSSWLYLTHPEIYSDKIRFWAHEPYAIDSVQVEVLRDGSWINVYSGSFPDGQWVEASFASGKVSQARIKFHMTFANHYFYYLVHEFDFWKIAEKPSVKTNSATDIKENQATLNGELTDLGGVHSVDVWFEWGKTIAYGNTTPPISKTTIGSFSATITGLSPATTYHFRAVASSAAGVSYGDNMTFTTLGACVPGTTTTCTPEEGCDHIIECPSEGYWPPCPRDECVKNTTNCLDCPCPEPEEGYESPEYGNCTEDCTCDIGTGQGEPCEPWLQPPITPTQLSETWNDCSFKELSIPTFNWDYFHPDGNPQAGYQIKIYGETTLDITSDIPSTSYTPPLTWVRDNLLFGEKTYSWQVRVKDNQNNWSDWSDVKYFQTRKYAYPWIDFSWIPPSPSQEEVVVFDPDESQTFDDLPLADANFSWTITKGTGTFTDDTNANFQYPHIKFSTSENKVKLRIRDSSGYWCEKEKDVSVRLPLPEYKEVPPTVWLKKFFAGIINFFDGFLKI